MRAATAIVGSIATASVLIALAFILSDSGSSPATVTKTVTEIVRAPQEKAEAPAGEETGGTQVGGPTICSGGEFTVENVSCEVGAQVRAQYEEGGRGELFAEDKGADETITMSCGGSSPVTCTGPGGAKVYFGK